MLSQQLYQLSNNICIYYAALSDSIYQQLMHKATQAGYQGLKLSHALILPQIASDGSRIVDIAHNQSVSKQAIGQIAHELEQLGLIEKIADKQDKRAKKLVLSPAGIELIRLCASFMQQVDDYLGELLGEAQFKRLHQLSMQLFKQLNLRFFTASQYIQKTQSIPLIAYAAPIADALDQQLKQSIGSKGHPPLKRSYWHILEKLSKSDVRINELAQMNGISKQAVSQLAQEIEKAGYIQRLSDAQDKRSKKLALTDKGRLLVNDTLLAIKELEQQLQQRLGQHDFSALKQVLSMSIARSQQTPNPSAEKFYAAITQLVKQQTIEANWLVMNSDKTYRLSPEALALLAQMHFTSNT